MVEAGIPAPPELTQDDRTMAIFAHVLQVVGWWIAPLIIFLVKRDSLFVKFHALQALILQLCLMVLWIIGMVVFFCGDVRFHADEWGAATRWSAAPSVRAVSSVLAQCHGRVGFGAGAGDCVRYEGGPRRMGWLSCPR